PETGFKERQIFGEVVVTRAMAQELAAEVAAHQQVADDRFTGGGEEGNRAGRMAGRVKDAGVDSEGSEVRFSGQKQVRLKRRIRPIQQRAHEPGGQASGLEGTVAAL